MRQITSLVSLTAILLQLNVAHGVLPSLSYEIQEEQGIVKVGNVAVDSHLYENVTSEEFQRMTFQILTQGNKHASKFKINESTSKLETAERLDREEICENQKECILTFNVMVYIQDISIDIYTVIKINVTLTDINDNAPQFPDPQITLTISESVSPGYKLITSGAYDRDTSEQNSVQSYEMNPSNEMFSLVLKDSDPSSPELEIVLNHPLDRETRNSYSLVVVAKDNGIPERNGTLNILILVEDTNDNPPVFTEAMYNATLLENIDIGSTVTTVTAHDTDADQNGEVSYSFHSQAHSDIPSLFALNSSSGEITVIGNIDFEDEQSYRFDVVAKDQGNPSKTAKTTVNIKILDENDNSPEISINLPSAGNKLSEAAEVDTYIAHFVVVDQDSGVNGKCSCEVAGENFRLEDFNQLKDNYKVVLNKSLDHEEKASYNVTIKCQDSAEPPRVSYASFLVLVEDVNDNFPVFTQPIYYAEMEENNPTGKFITQVLAVDQDAGANGVVKYMMHPSAASMFSIHSTSGIISVNDEIDREKWPQIIFQVLAYDQGETSLTSTATVTLDITDVNDNAPIFESDPVHLYIWENQMAEVTMPVDDPDNGSNGTFFISFPRNPELLKFFTFNQETKVIATVNKIDREVNPFFEFNVNAYDTGTPVKTSSARVIIHIRDSNDNVPAISYPKNSNRTRHISVGSEVGTFVVKIEAEDDDEGQNGELSYFIDGGDSRGIFYINENTGEIFIGKELNDNDAGRYLLDISVQDHGETPIKSYTKMEIVILESNATTSPVSDPEGQHNILIVIIIVIVTIVFSALIIVVILVVCRIDRNRKLKSSNIIYEPKMYDPKMSDPKVDESLSASSNMSKDSDAELLKKRNKKEVSFSLSDKESINDSSLTNVTSFTTFDKTPNSYLSDIKLSEDPQTSSSWFDNNTISTEHNKTDSYGDKERDISSLTQQKLHQAALIQQHLQNPERGQHWLHPVHEEEAKGLMSMLRKADDTASVASGTSDSGRGGSEEDINSNRGHTLSDSEECKHFYPADNRAIDFKRSSGRQSNQYFKQSPKVPALDSYHRNISFSDDSVTANTTVNSSAKYPHKNHFSPHYSNIHTPQTPYRGSGRRELFTISGQTPTKDTFMDTQMSQGLPYSLADIDDVVSEQTCTRDDASTTTSGSYTINPEELCNEIDELFFKDVIV